MLQIRGIDTWASIAHEQNNPPMIDSALNSYNFVAMKKNSPRHIWEYYLSACH